MPDEPANAQEWRKVLIEGHKPLRVAHLFFRHLPSAPRCKLCHNPFGGVGGKVLRVAGYRPSRKNPNLCSRCCESLPIGGAEVDVAVLFADVRGSTSLGEHAGPEEFAALLNRFYVTATEVLVRHDAIIDKLIGDEVMALFIPGIAGKRYRQRAVEGAVALLRALGYGERSDAPGPWLPLGAAVHAGTAYVGNVGGEGVVDFTALGDPINVAARLQGEAAPGELVVSDVLDDVVAQLGLTTERRRIDVRGRAEPVAAHVIAL